MRPNDEIYDIVDPKEIMRRAGMEVALQAK